MKYNKEHIKGQAIKLIKKKKLCYVSDITKHGVSLYYFYRKYKLHEDTDILALIEENLNNKKDFEKKALEPEIKAWIDKSLKLLRKVDEDGDRENILITRWVELCSELHIPYKKFSEWGITQNEEILMEFDYHKSLILRIKKGQLLEDESVGSVALAFRVFGDDELRKKTAINYSENKNKNENETKIVFQNVSEKFDIDETEIE